MIKLDWAWQSAGVASKTVKMSLYNLRGVPGWDGFRGVIADLEYAKSGHFAIARRSERF